MDVTTDKTPNKKASPRWAFWDNKHKKEAPDLEPIQELETISILEESLVGAEQSAPSDTDLTQVHDGALDEPVDATSVINPDMVLLEDIVQHCNLESDGDSLDCSFFSDKDIALTPEQITFVQTAIRCKFPNHRNHAVQQEPEPSEPSELPEPPLFSKTDMSYHIWISQDRMQAWGLCIPPTEDGRVLALQGATDCLKHAKVSFGVNAAALEQSLTKSQWLKLTLIASGELPKDGADGYIVDHYSRELDKSFTEDEHEAVDYKNLNWIKKVSQGDIVCSITHPIPSVNGMNVYGKVLYSKTPHQPTVPKGDHTLLSEDGTALVAECDGQLVFLRNLFHIQQILHINGDVDNEVGNIDAIGNVVVHGNVREGFSVKATGNVIVHGIVRGANIDAGQDIQVSIGVKGNRKSKLIAGGSVRCQYLESCSVNAKKSITAESLIDSVVVSGDTISVMSGKGVIIGGTTCAQTSIQAKTIGNNTYVPTAISINNPDDDTHTISCLQEFIAEMDLSISNLTKDIAYLSSKKTLDATGANCLKQLKLKLTVSKMSYQKKQTLLESLVNKPFNTDGQIIANYIYPSTTVNIKGQKLLIKESTIRPRIYINEGELTIGMQ